MMNNSEDEKKSFFQTTTAKLLMVGLLTFTLLIPLFLIQDLITERSLTQKEVIAETTQKWGTNIYVYGPILRIPYTTFENVETTNALTNSKTVSKKTSLQYAYFFPNELKNTTKTEMQPALQRSIYKSNVFTTKMNFNGNFSVPDFSTQNIPNENIQWNKASIIIKTTNLKSLQKQLKITINSTQFSFEPMADREANDSIEGLETAAIPLKWETKTAFNLDISYNGSDKISIVPIGKTTNAKMTSNWNSPNFNGNFIPSSKKITKDGFIANWNILHFNRPFSQSHFGHLPNLSKYAFSVRFVNPVNEYQQNERASKYGFLVIALTFLIFFLIQTLSKINIHLFQYTMIGVALLLFYTLLIAITEHSSFPFAYAVAAISVIVLISLYSISILKNIKFPVLIGLSLSILYTFIFVIIQLEDYALLVGSIGIFAILAAVMFFSRKIDWK
jgi:inner membrane protein